MNLQSTRFSCQAANEFADKECQTEQARPHYTLHRQSRHRILSDLGRPDKTLNLKLTAWWELSFVAFRREIKKVFKQDIPLAERDEWETWFQQRRAQHERTTAAIVRLETELNERVYENNIGGW